MKYSKEFLTDIVRDSISISDVVRKLGCNPKGSMHGHISKRLQLLEIDTSHFDPNHANRNPHRKGNGNKRKPETILLLRNNVNGEHAHVVRRALVESGTLYICSKCGQTPVWNKKPLTLEVNHKDGNRADNRKSNLEFLCPNCHSQEPTSTSSRAVNFAGMEK